MSAPDISNNNIPYMSCHSYHQHTSNLLDVDYTHPLLHHNPAKQPSMDRLRAEEFYHCKPFSAENLQPTVSVTNRLSSWQALGDLSEVCTSDDEDNMNTGSDTKRDTVVKVTFHVQDFQPRDISVSICDDVLHVDAAAHDAQSDEVRRLFRKVRIPNEVDAEKITSRWTTDGTLTIEVPIVQAPKE